MTAIASLFDEALRHPSPGYALGKRLAEMFPDRALAVAVSAARVRA
jgi:hypothetical protein